MLSLKAFYGRVVAIAFSGKFWFAEKIAGGVGLFLGVFVWWLGRGGDAVNWLPFVAFLAILLPAVTVGLIVAPWQIYREAAAKKEEAERRLAPRLQLSLVDKGGSRILFGGTSQSMLGNRYSSITGDENILRVTCTNQSALRVTECEAMIFDVKRVETDGALSDIGFHESVNLSWSRSLKPPDLTCSIDPKASKAIYVARATMNGALVLYKGTDMPLEYHHLMTAPGVYRLWVKVSGHDTVSAEIAVDVRAVTGERGAAVEAVQVDSAAVDPLTVPLRPELLLSGARRPS